MLTALRDGMQSRSWLCSRLPADRDAPTDGRGRAALAMRAVLRLAVCVSVSLSLFMSVSLYVSTSLSLSARVGMGARASLAVLSLLLLFFFFSACLSPLCLYLSACLSPPRNEYSKRLFDFGAWERSGTGVAWPVVGVGFGDPDNGRP